MKKKQLFYIDALRVVSSLCVLLYHYTTRYESIFGHSIVMRFSVPWGCGAVNVFLLLTGYLTVLSVSRNPSVGQFIKSRVVRLYPEYWASVIVTSICTYLFLPQLFVGFKSIIVNFTMLQAFLGIPNVDGAYWTLAFQLVFYFWVLLSLLVTKISHKYKFSVFLFMWLILSYMFILIDKTQINIPLIGFLRLALIPQLSAAFITGGMLAFMEKEPQKWKRCIYTIGVIASVVLAYITQERSYFCFLVLSAVVVFYFGVIGKNRDTSKKTISFYTFKSWISFCASISYPLYLIHQYFGFVIINFLERQLGITSWLLIICIPMICSFVVAVFVNKLSTYVIKRIGVRLL